MEHLEGKQSILAALEARQRRFDVILIRHGTHEEKIREVLDRAIVIDMSTVDLRGFLTGLEMRYPSLATARKACETHLVTTHGLMTGHGLGFGYRVAEEVVRYHAFAAEYLGAAAEATTDDLMVQKVLVKLRGAEKQRHLLTGLARALVGLPHSQAFIARLTADLDEFGSFQASR